jgi:tetratricopeptide (TPR) repeat protein
MPQLLLVTRRDPKASAHDEATRIAMQDAVIGLMRNAGHYQVTVYSPTQPRIKQALLTHAISSIDLNEPLQPEGMRHLALALGVRTVLFLAPTFEKTELKMEVQLYQNVAQDAWQLTTAGDATTPYQYGKRRLNSKEVIAFTVDALAARLSLPSHMAADLNLKTMEAATTPKKPTKADQARNTTGTKAVKSAPPETQPDPSTAQAAAATPDTNTTPPVVAQPPDPAVVQPAAPRVTKTRGAKADKTASSAPTSADILANKTNAVQTGGVPAPEGGTGRADVPVAQTVAHPNYETLADHYHDNHDLANTITWLRYAVNERPRDIPLRHKLILAYQERKMPEAALAEISRALELAPNDGGLYRAYGETLMNKGEVPAAEKAFRDAVRLNAGDMQARIALGDALMTDNQYADAMDTYTAAQMADPRSPLPHRRLARALLMRASADPTQYAGSLEEINKAQQLTPPNDKISYQDDYGTLMAITEARLRELLEEITGNLIALTKGKQSGNDTLRALSDMQIRTDAITDYLDKAPAAQGQDATRIHYQQAATLLLSSITLFRSNVNKNDSSIKQQMQDASTEAYQELDTAHKRLADVRDALVPK